MVGRDFILSVGIDICFDMGVDFLYLFLQFYDLCLIFDLCSIDFLCEFLLLSLSNTDIILQFMLILLNIF